MSPRFIASAIAAAVVVWTVGGALAVVLWKAVEALL